MAVRPVEGLPATHPEQLAGGRKIFGRMQRGPCGYQSGVARDRNPWLREYLFPNLPAFHPSIVFRTRVPTGGLLQQNPNSACALRWSRAIPEPLLQATLETAVGRAA